jgi:hypothetical protein
MGIQTSAKDQLPSPGLCRTLSGHRLHGYCDRRLGAALTIFYGTLVPVGLFRLKFLVPLIEVAHALTRIPSACE